MFSATLMTAAPTERSPALSGTEIMARTSRIACGFGRKWPASAASTHW
jgi:hypothetical protein